jgi:hypothetical protein
VLNGLKKQDLRVSEPGSRTACFLLSQTAFFKGMLKMQFCLAPTC